jgi:2-amino-4-hydroxy-6-hydroxymethyldihydropteridine diphosphokinase
MHVHASDAGESLFTLLGYRPLQRANGAVNAVIALGSNLGDSVITVEQAIEALSKIPGVDLVAKSPFYRSAPHQAEGDDYINAVIEVRTHYNPHDLLRLMQAVELTYGRRRSTLNAPRTLDLDLIFYGSARIESQSLTVPHPRWSERAFVLLPLSTIAPERVTGEMLEQVKHQPIAQLAR